MLEVRDLHAYYGKSHILQGVDLNIAAGEVVSLLGRNGVGRSTTVKAIMGEVPPQGTIRFKGKDIAGLPSYKIAHHGLGYVPEHRDIFPGLTVRQNLLLGVKDTRRPGKWKLEGMLEMFPESRRARRHAGRRALRRREADADDLPHPDGRSRTDHDRRADRRSGAADRAAGRRSHRDASPRLASPSCWSSRSCRSRCGSRTASTSWATAASCSRVRRTNSRPTTPSARNGSRCSGTSLGIVFNSSVEDRPRFASRSPSVQLPNLFDRYVHRHDRSAGAVRTFACAIDRKRIIALVSECGGVPERRDVKRPERPMRELSGDARAMHRAWNSDREIARFARPDREIGCHIDAKHGWIAGNPAVRHGESCTRRQAQYSSYCRQPHAGSGKDEVISGQLIANSLRRHCGTRGLRIHLTADLTQDGFRVRPAGVSERRG